MMRIRDQLRAHSVALVSLAVAVTSLGYNTWRNEQTEANRNLRTAGVQLLLKLGELDQVAFYARYEMDELRGNPRTGWAIVLLIRDLGALTPPPTGDSVAALFRVWNADANRMANDAAAYERISAAIDRVRDDVRGLLAELD